MRNVEHIYMNVLRWTGRKIEEGTPWMDAAAEVESALSELDSLLGEFGGIGFSSQMGILSDVTDGINAMRDARKYLHEEIVRLIDRPLEECYARAVEALSAIDFDEIRVVNHAGVEINNLNVGGNNAKSQSINEYSLSDVLKGKVPELNKCVGYNQKIDGFGEILAEMGGFTLAELQGKNDDSDEKKGFWEEIAESVNNFFAYHDFGRANDPTGNPPDETIFEIISGISKNIIKSGEDISNILKEFQKKNISSSNEEIYIKQQTGYVMSYNSVELLKKLELADYQLKDIGVYNSKNELIGMMPYYVMINGDAEGWFKDDGGITVGFGHHISADEWKEATNEDSLFLKQYVPENIQITGVVADTNTIPQSCIILVPDSQMIPIDVIEELLDKDIKVHCEKVEKMLIDDGITVNQNEFDALVIYRYNRGSISKKAEELLIEGNRCEEDWEKIWTGGDNRKEECQKLFFKKE